MRVSVLILLSLVAVAFTSNEYGLVTGDPSEGTITLVSTDGTSMETIYYSNIQHPSCSFLGDGNVYFGDYDRDTGIPSIVRTSSNVRYFVPRTILVLDDYPQCVVSQIKADEAESYLIVLLSKIEEENEVQTTGSFDYMLKVDLSTGEKSVVYTVDESDTTIPIPTSFWIGHNIPQQIYFTANQITKSIGHSTNTGIWYFPLDSKNATIEAKIYANVPDVTNDHAVKIDSLDSIDEGVFFYVLHNTATQSSLIQSVNAQKVITTSDNDFDPDQMKVIPSGRNKVVAWARQGNQFYSGVVSNGNDASNLQPQDLLINYDVTYFDINYDGVITYSNDDKAVLWKCDTSVDNPSSSSYATGVDDSVHFYAKTNENDIDIYFSSFDVISHISKNEPYEISLMTGGGIIEHMVGYSNETTGSVDFFYVLEGQTNIIVSTDPKVPPVVTIRQDVTAMTIDDQQNMLYFTTTGSSDDSDLDISRISLDGTQGSNGTLIHPYFNQTNDGPCLSIDFGIDGYLYYGTGSGVYYLNPNTTDDHGFTLNHTDDINPFALYNHGNMNYYLDIYRGKGLNEFSIVGCMIDQDSGKCIKTSVGTLPYPYPTYLDNKGWMVGKSTGDYVYWTSSNLGGDIYGFNLTSQNSTYFDGSLAVLVNPDYDDSETTGLAISPDDSLISISLGTYGVIQYSINDTVRMLPINATAEYPYFNNFTIAGKSIGAIAHTDDHFFWVDIYEGTIMMCSSNINDCSNASQVIHTIMDTQCIGSQFLTVSGDYLYYQEGCGGIGRVNITDKTSLQLQSPTSDHIDDLIVEDGDDETLLWALGEKKIILTASVVNEVLTQVTDSIVGSGTFDALAVGTKFDDDDDQPRLHWVDTNSRRMMMYHDGVLSSMFPYENAAGLYEFKDDAPKRSTTPSPSRSLVIGASPTPSQTQKFYQSVSNGFSPSPSPIYPPVIDQSGWIFIGCAVAIVLLFCCVPLAYCAWRDSKQKELALSLRFEDE